MIPEAHGSSPVAEGTVLWEPTPERVAGAPLTAFARWLERHTGRAFVDYDELWSWSVERVEEFWAALWTYHRLGPSPPAGRVLRRGTGAEGARWFGASELNYADLPGRHPDGDLALIAWDEEGEHCRLTYGELRERAGAVAAGLRALGVGPGDRVAAVLTNGAEAVIALLATASLGAVWSACAPEFGAQGMIDRLAQIEPTVLLAVGAYRYGGRRFDIGPTITALEEALPTLAATVVVGDGSSLAVGERPRRLGWDELGGTPGPLAPTAVPFAHPLWILYSSGTTGLPKPIVQSHGGIVLEHLKALGLHCDLGPGERFLWYTTTGWMMWNFLVGGLLLGATVVCFDGHPLWPDPDRLWRLAGDLGITYLGTGAPFLESCRSAGASPRHSVGPLAVRTVGSTGSPLSPEGFAWASTEVGEDVQVASVSGGTDVCSAFLGSCAWRPVRAGELQCRMLGVAAAAFDDDGVPVEGEVGELVITQPLPSMPIALWGDDGSRLHDSYFARYPGVWRHGDWVRFNPDGSSVVYGRSDATLNRGGVRTGTAEFYRVVEALDEVSEALVVDTTELGRRGELVLFVVPAGAAGTPGPAPLDEATVVGIRRAGAERLSPRHVPDRVIAVPSIPRTLNGKKIEVPVRRILLGRPVDEAVAGGALVDPSSLGAVIDAWSGASADPRAGS